MHIFVCVSVQEDISNHFDMYATVKLDVGTVPHYRKCNLHYWTAADGQSSHNNRSVKMRMNCRQLSTCWVGKVILIIRLLKVNFVQRYPSDSHNQVLWPRWLPNLWMYDTAKALLIIAYPTASAFYMPWKWIDQYNLQLGVILMGIVMLTSE